MRRQNTIVHKFVEFIPNELEPGTLYISIEYATAVHKCCCGCGSRVVTPLSPTDWKLIFDGRSASLDPSIGNWSFPCRSHYWIKNDQVKWAPKWSQQEIDRARVQDRRAKIAFESRGSMTEGRVRSTASAWNALWRRVRRWFGKSSDTQ